MIPGDIEDSGYLGKSQGFGISAHCAIYQVIVLCDVVMSIGYVAGAGMPLVERSVAAGLRFRRGLCIMG